MQTKVFIEMRDFLSHESLHEIAMKYVHSDLQSVRKDVAALHEDHSLNILILDPDYEVRMVAASAGRKRDLSAILKDSSRQVKIEYIKAADISCLDSFLKYNKPDILSAIVSREDSRLNKEILDRVIENSNQSKPTLLSYNLICSLITYDHLIAEVLYLNLDERYYNIITNSVRNVHLVSTSKELLNTLIKYSKNESSVAWAKRYLNSSK